VALLRTFNGLSIRKKMMVLHNLFFAVLVLILWLVVEASLAEHVGPVVGDSSATMTQAARGFRVRLFVGLLLAYGLAVLILETLILPPMVYRPLRRWLDADEASRRGDRDNELIPETVILPDELGHLARSRNLTLTLLRQRQGELENALQRLEDAAADLMRKNHLLETAKRNLADQDRLASLGILSAGVAHELNTPLAVLQGSLEKLREDTSDPRLDGRIQRMLRVTTRLKSISESLLDFARARSTHFSSVEVRPLLEEALALVRLDPKASRVEFRLEIDQGDRVLGNADRLLQVFVNLLRNAVDAVENGGAVTVSSRREDRETGPWIKLLFVDNGPGIEPEILPRIFEPFVTSRLDARGTGLGLAVAEGIVDQHGGGIVARNGEHGGAEFEVTLPCTGPAGDGDGGNGRK